MSGQARDSGVYEFFSQGGVLSRAHKDFEFRPDQLKMAQAVSEAIRDQRQLLVEAGTGTGKTLAYLVPSILSGKRVVVSTGTKNLQEQLYFKDIPFLKEALGRELRVCYMKGRANYACRQKIYDAQSTPMLDGLEEVSDFQIIREWEDRTETGDRSELKDLRDDSTVWSKIDARGDRCSGQKCNQFDRCFITQMHRRAQESDVIIVNHHLFFADLAVRENDFSSILPDYSVVVFDEAHEIENVAGSYFGASVSNLQIQDLVFDVVAASRQHLPDDKQVSEAARTLERASMRFFQHFRGPEGRYGFRAQDAFMDAHEDDYLLLLNGLSLVGSTIQALPRQPEAFLPFERRAAQLVENLNLWMESRSADYVYWLERRGRSISLQATPIDVAAILHEKLFDPISTIVLTSATLAVAHSFDYLIRRLGLQEPRTLQVEGSFDYEKQGLLFAAEQLPDPRNASFGQKAASLLATMLEISQGRAFVLCTSYQQMKYLYERLRDEIPFPALIQGSMPKSALLDEFRSTPNAVLFATASFWQGVDVPGEQLSLVVVDKLPFAVPNDPVVSARIQKIRENGGNPFFEYQIPQAALALKQGFGRLIRSGRDRGVVAILDSRIVRQKYGKVFLESLPPYRKTGSLAEVEAFFDLESGQ
jgi:ATP-dependent DNA helicase DinG